MGSAFDTFQVALLVTMLLHIAASPLEKRIYWLLFLRNRGENTPPRLPARLYLHYLRLYCIFVCFPFTLLYAVFTALPRISEHGFLAPIEVINVAVACVSVALSMILPFTRYADPLLKRAKAVNALGKYRSPEATRGREA